MMGVTDLLEQQGFEIIDRNWKTKVCEIDIVAEKDKGRAIPKPLND